LGEHLRVGLGTADIDRSQPAVETDRLGEPFDPRIGGLLETAAPGFG
jgi:hypothetical protein